MKPVKIGVISDTHCKSLSDLPPVVLSRLEGCSAIIHAGDAEYCSFLKELETLAPVYSVMGNNDKEWKTQPLEMATCLKIGKFTIGITHGHYGNGRNTVERAMSVFREVDMIIYGHNHREAGLHRRDGILLLNPGSPTDTRQPYSSMATLYIGNAIDVRMTNWRNRGEGRKKPASTTSGRQKAEPTMATEKAVEA